MSEIDQEISRRIKFLRYSMIFGIVILHTPPYVPLAETGTTFFDLFKAFFQHAFFRASVPVLTFISGYLLFSSSLDLKFRLLVKKKTKTILNPLILFNLPLVFLLYFVQFSHLIDYEFSQQVYPFDVAVWLDAITGLNGSPVNYPLNFLRDLYIISISAPVFGLLIRRYPLTGLVGVFILFWFNFDGPIILRNTMPIVFYLGGLAAVYQWDLKALDKYAVIFFTVFLALCVAIVYFDIENRNYLRVVSPILIWPAAALVVNTRFGLWVSGMSKYSFFTFLMQGPLLLALWLVYQKLFTVIPYWIFWATAPILTAIILAYFYKLTRYRFPRIMQFALGGR
jgi:succinoglycan biosynthesis protein ExoH